MGYKTPMGRIVYREDGTLHIVKYTVCTKVGKKNKILVVKWDSFNKYASRQKVVRNVGSDVKKRIGIILRFVSMSITSYKEHLHLIASKVLMSN